MRSPARSIAVLLLACSAVGLGCFEPLQSGGVMIIGDPNERIAAMCRFRHHDSVSELCGSEGAGDENEGATADFEDTSANSDSSSTNAGQERRAPGR